MNAPTAVQGQDTKNMRALLKASSRLLSQAGIRGKPLPVVNHSDETGFRPDVLLHVDEAVHPRVLDYVAAWHGLIHGAPSVVAFNSHTSGRDRMHVIDTTHPSRTVGDALRSAGVPKFSVHGGRAYVFDQGGAYDLTQVARSLNARSYHSLAGTGRVIGAGQGADAASGRAAYRTTIDAAERAAGGAGPDAAGSAEVRDPAVVKLGRADTPVKLAVSVSDMDRPSDRSGKQHYAFPVGKHQYRVSFSPGPHGRWGMWFSRGGEMGATGDMGHSAPTVFASVGNALHHFITTHDPSTITFDASLDEPSRVRLYDRVHALLAKKYGMTPESEELGTVKKYELHASYNPDEEATKLARKVSTNRMVGLKAPVPQHVFDELANWTGQSVVKPTPALQVLADVHPAVAEWLGRYGLRHVSAHKSKYAPAHPGTYEDDFKAALEAKFPDTWAQTSWRYKHGLVKPPGLIRLQHNYAELQLHDPATGEWHQVSMHGVPGPGGDEDDTPHGLRSHVWALKGKLARAGWHTDRVWHEDTPPQVLAQFLEDNPEHAHDGGTYDTLREIMDGTTRTHLWGQHPETGALAVWLAGHQMPFPHPSGFIHTSKVPLAVKRTEFHQHLPVTSRPIPQVFPFESHGPGGHYGVRAVYGGSYSVEPHDLHGWGVGAGGTGRTAHRDIESAKADAIARAWPASHPDVRLSRPKAKDVKSGLAGWEEVLRTHPESGAVLADYLQERDWAHGEGVDTGTNPTLEFLRSGHPVKLGIHPVSGKVLAWGAGRMGIGTALRIQHPIDVEGPHGAYRVRERASGHWGYHHASLSPEADTYGQYASRDSALRAAKHVAFQYPVRHVYRGPAGMAAVESSSGRGVHSYAYLHPDGQTGLRYGTHDDSEAEAHRHAAFLAGLPVEGELSPHMRRIQQERNES